MDCKKLNASLQKCLPEPFQMCHRIHALIIQLSQTAHKKTPESDSLQETKCTEADDETPRFIFTAINQAHQLRIDTENSQKAYKRISKFKTFMPSKNQISSYFLVNVAINLAPRTPTHHP